MLGRLPSTRPVATRGACDPGQVGPTPPSLSRIVCVVLVVLLASPDPATAPRGPERSLRAVQDELDHLALRMDPLTRMWMALEPTVHGLQREIRAIQLELMRQATTLQFAPGESSGGLWRIRQAQRELAPLLPAWRGIKAALHRYHRAARRILANVGVGALRGWPRPSPGRGPFGACPVAGPFWFVGSFGAARGPLRTHAGQDLFAARGTPVLAVAGGTVTPVPNSLGGLAVYLDGADGTRWYHAHLSAYGDLGPVRTGDVIGYVGSTGNARGLAPHLHFEYRPSGASAVDPAAELLLACR